LAGLHSLSARRRDAKAPPFLQIPQTVIFTKGESMPAKRATACLEPESLTMLKVVERPLHALHPYPGNAKTHGKRQLSALARNFLTMGFLNPILIDESGQILAGHGRYEAARIAGFEKVPTISIRHLSSAQKKAYRIADNRLGGLDTGWSIEKLNDEVAAILTLDGAFDLDLTGFDASDLELKLDLEESRKDEAEEPPVADVAAAAVTKPGDLWILGEHRLLCGSALEEQSYRSLLGDKRASMLFTDPPYNCPIAGHVSGLGKHRHREFVQGAGEMSDSEFQRFLLTFMIHCARFYAPGALHYICMDWRRIKKLLIAGDAAYDELLNLCVWAKTNAGMGSLYRSQLPESRS
jgi:ParB-like chromosome segregation protein Spo0J